MNKVVTTLLLLVLCLAVRAQVNLAEPERPAQSMLPTIVPKKWVQLEAGLAREAELYLTGGRNRIFQHPSLTTRYGLVKGVELRWITDISTNRLRDSRGITTTFGVRNFQVGAKVHLFKQKGVVPNTSIVAHYDFNQFKYFGYDTINGINERLAMQNTV